MILNVFVSLYDLYYALYFALERKGYDFVIERSEDAVKEYSQLLFLKRSLLEVIDDDKNILSFFLQFLLIVFHLMSLLTKFTMGGNKSGFYRHLAYSTDLKFNW